MDSIFDHYKKTGYLHHAHVIEGVHDIVVPILVVALAKHLGIETQGNPDLMVKFYESLGVDEARELKAVQTQAGFGDGRKIFIIGANSFTREAQNALLKTFEEPTEGTHFFIILPHAEMLLPTLRSRVLVVAGNIEVSVDETKALAEKFLDSSLEGRFTLAKKLAEKKTGETVDRELFRRILDHIERILYTRMAGKHTDSTSNIFHEIFQAKTYLADRGSSPKMLLEHIAMVILLK
ncbi:MAG: hypothetical protein HZB10_03635 [Candidatus Yonathbacteria bacterium]|nr:hypothetical protein [Candidatus Yonathbacteria bacterium]